MESTAMREITKMLAGESAELVGFFPYIVQDLWELGVNTDNIMALMSKHGIQAPLRILDLGCGKGAAAVRIARHFDAWVKGIDLMPEFIQAAREQAVRYRAQDQCEFELGDMIDAVESERGYDMVIYAVIKEVFGPTVNMLRKVQQPLRPRGYLVIDDSYLRPGVSEPAHLAQSVWEKSFEEAELDLIDFLPREEEYISFEVKYNMDKINPRIDELIATYPDKRKLFEGYKMFLARENMEKEATMIGATWLLQKRG